MTLRMAVAVLCMASTVVVAQQPYVVWSGGVGLEERATAPATGTRLIFMGDEGHFVANVHVVIKRSDGQVLVDTTCPGPWLILNLPAGEYDMRAELAGKATGGHLNVGEAPQQVAYRFNGL